MMAKRVSRFPLLLAALAFLTYVGAITWHNEAYKSTWRTEQSGSLLVATSYLFYGSPFGSIAAEQWNYVLKYVAFRSASQEKHADELLKFSANHNRSAKPNTIGRMTTAGVVTQFPLPVSFSFPRTITSGADGTLWFTEYEDGGKIVRITTAGVITEFATPTRNSQPLGITMGPDGALWFTEYAGNNIGRLCPSSMDSSGDCKGDKAAERAAWHEITEYAIPTSTSTPTFIAAGPDGALWFSEESSGKIGRITTA